MKPISEYDSPTELRQIMVNAKRLKDDRVYWEAFSRLCLLSGRDEPDPLIREFYATLAAYEELLTQKNRKTTIASRTRQKLKRRGVLECLNDWAFQPSSDGLRLLVSKGLIELTGEYLVVKYSGRFSPAAVQAAKAKIDTLQTHSQTQIQLPL